jgi:polyisoprenoid-binding protein YceI
MRLRSLLSFALPAAASLMLAAQAAAADYRLDPAKSSLSFAFTQAGAQNKGRFAKFEVSLALDPAQARGGRLDVTVQVSSLDTGDKDRDATLRSADLFDPVKYPQARFSSMAITRVDASHFQAAGKLTIRNVTRDLTVPFSFTTTSEAGHAVASMAGQVVIKRLDFGVGQGEWKSTDGVGNDVTVSFALRLTPAA